MPKKAYSIFHIYAMDAINHQQSYMKPKALPSFREAIFHFKKSPLLIQSP